jgi:hypothetical protein
MANVAVIGAQWGDEGKGKVVDWLASRADIVVRFQGGHNAGHTLVINGVTYKLSLLPSGVVREGKISVIGNGVVIDPEHLFKEIAAIEEKGVKISPENLMIADNCCLILPIHQEVDKAAEEKKGLQKIGTTGRGIGPGAGQQPGWCVGPQAAVGVCRHCLRPRQGRRGRAPVEPIGCGGAGGAGVLGCDVAGGALGHHPGGRGAVVGGLGFFAHHRPE